jgi:hypothetical protein
VFMSGSRNRPGLIVLERNYLDVFPYDKWNDNELPDFAEGEEHQPSEVELRDGQTTKPNLLTEADLVSLMDKNGIGSVIPRSNSRFLTILVQELTRPSPNILKLSLPEST